MSHATQAMLVLIGTVGFFMVPVLGPALEDGLQLVVQTVLGVDDEHKAAQAKLPGYKGTPLEIAADCCAECEQHWNYDVDRCDIGSREANACVRACGAVRTK
ncbi:MAG: hypothetical protein KC583_22490 [Myxococcales bacterium]|nr:hypothetical protein [Myxococcales bacterium]